MSTYTVTDEDGRLALTEDEQRLVPDDDPEARWLYATPGQEIPMEDAEKFGLAKKAAPKAAPKEQTKPADKQQGKPATKATTTRAKKGAAK